MAAKTQARSGRESQVDADGLARFRVALLTERSAQAPLAAEHEATVTELTGQSDVDSILERELADAAVARARATIDEIDAALVRLAAGSYGVCESCGAAIPSDRLDAIPHARTCVRCPVHGVVFRL